MRTERNPETDVLEGFVKGKILHIPDAILRTKEKGTEYRTVRCIGYYPDGSSEEVDATMWENAHRAVDFRKDQEIVLRVTLEGDYAGSSVVQLAERKRFDMSKFKGALADVKETKDEDIEADV